MKQFYQGMRYLCSGYMKVGCFLLLVVDDRNVSLNNAFSGLLGVGRFSTLR